MITLFYRSRPRLTEQPLPTKSSLFIALLLTVLMIVGCKTTPSPQSSNAASIATQKPAGNQVSKKAESKPTNPTVSTDGEYYIGMPDSELGSLSPVETEMLEFDDFMVLTTTGGLDSDLPSNRFNGASGKQAFYTAAKIFEEEMSIEEAAIPESMGYIWALHNIGAHGRSLETLKLLQKKMQRDFELEKSGDYETSFFDLVETNFVATYSQMLGTYSLYYETLGDYRQAMHYAIKAHRIKENLHYSHLTGNDDIRHFATMARLHALNGEPDKVKPLLNKVDVFESPTIFGIQFHSLQHVVWQ